MALLLNTNVQDQVNQKIRGRIARIGGVVDQLLSYDDCTVHDFNVADGGYGKVRSGIWAFFSVRKYVSQEMRFIKEGWRIPRDRKAIIMDMHSAYKNSQLFSKYDAVISSNVIEHSPNPIWLLLNFYIITKPDGFQYHAIPHYKYTYDVHRKPTAVEHMIRDFEEFADQTDTVHNEDYVQSAIDKHGWQKEFHEKYPVAYPYMHFHVFDEFNTRELFKFVFEDVQNDIIKTEQFSDNVVLCRNTLKSRFLRQYEDLIEKYKDEFEFFAHQIEQR